MKEQTFGYGDKTWNNIHELMGEAASARHFKEDNIALRHLVGALVSRGPLRASVASVEAHLKFDLAFDAATNEYVVTPRRTDD